MNTTSRIAPAAAASILVLIAGGCETTTTTRSSSSTQVSSRETRNFETERTKATTSSSQDSTQQGKKEQARRGQIFGTSEMSFPTGDKDSSLVRVSAKGGMDQVRVGQPFTYQLAVTNLSKEITLENVAVHQDMPQTLRVASVKPEGITAGDRPGTFMIGHLDPGETKNFEVSMVPEQAGRFDTCVRVTYSPVLCTTIDVVAPELRLVKEAPERVMVCQPIPLRYVVTNTGTGSTDEVIIREQLPEGITGPNGARTIELNAGKLGAGESKTLTVNLRAERPGELSGEAVAMSRDGLEARADARPTLVWAPQIDLEVTGPQQEYAGKPLEYRAMVHNKGDGPAPNAKLKLNISPDAKLISSNVPVKGGYADIPLGDIAPGQSKEVVFLFQVPKPGEVKFSATASADCATAPSREVVTALRGVSSLLLEVVDNFDPVKIGGQEVYQIMVVNQGAIADQNVRIMAVVPDAFEVVNIEGPTQAQRDGNRLVFAPVATLGPTEKVVWNVTVRAVREGDVRFRTEMVSDTLTEPVIETEATRVY
jgi:hypothetical protein